MAYNEVIVLILELALIMLLMYVAFTQGKEKGNRDGYADAYNEGKSFGYVEGLRDGFKSYQDVDEAIFARTSHRQKEAAEEIKNQIDELNKTLVEADRFPPELLLAYGVGDVRDLPRDVREAYGIKVKVGGVVNGTE
jgi:hypothetical protein